MHTEPLITPTLKRCAIYTRKSVQPPIPQEITSLESQRAICSAYISSQQHKSWVELKKKYDDPGRSGSNLDRPALQDLLADIEGGLIDVVLVYKLDRITRTLLDFVRLIDLFERYGVVFVAITQNFDTSDSMGRLIRNVLLTFAQFEREIAADRMRDKVRVMKQRGLWTGGDAPLGYDLRRGKLVINREEEPAVRCIFDTYVKERRLTAVHRKLLEQGFRRKVWKSRSGAVRGGTSISQGSVHHVLSNPVYVGEVSHRGERYPGIHEPIIDRALWDRAQEVLAERQLFRPALPVNLLSGLLFDGYGRRMDAKGGSNRFGDYRYYASTRVAWAIRQKIKPVRANADYLERLVIEAIKSLLIDRLQIRLLLMESGVFGVDLDKLAQSGGEASVRLSRLSIRQLSCVLRSLLQRVEVHSQFVRIVFRSEVLPTLIRWDGVGSLGLSELELARAKQLHIIDVPAAVARERKKHSLPISHHLGQPAKVDPGLVSLLYDARLAQRLIFDNRDKPIAELARSFGRRSLSFTRLVRLNYLAPDIVASILDGEQPAGMSRKLLMQLDLPIDWTLQRRLLGFSPRAQSELPGMAQDC